MNSVKLLRRVFILLTVLVVLAVFLLMFQFTDVAFRVWDRLQNTSSGFLIVYLLGVGFLAFAGLFLIYKIWSLGRSKPAEKMAEKPLRTLEGVQTRLEKAREHGMEVSRIADDLAEAEDLQPERDLSVAFFGKISTGKSSLIQTLLPNARIETSIIGGSTARIERYQYTLPSGMTLKLLDMPGTHQAQTVASLENEVMDETRRVHIVCYVLDQDMTASDQESIAELHHFGKPLVVVLNKINRYEADERELLLTRIRQRIPEDARLVAVSSAYPQTYRRVSADGKTQLAERLGGGEIRPLLEAFAELEGRRGTLQTRQRQALIDLADDSLSHKLGQYRRERGAALVTAYSRKAMLGGVAAVGPGTDILIQGYLGVDMVKALCKLYDVPVQGMDLQTLVEAASSKVKGHLTLILALTGNVCKAFPGVGTVLGGASHAIAYGLIFESLGRACMQALEQNRGGIRSEDIIQHFEEQLSRDLEKRATSLVKEAIAGRGKRSGSESGSSA